MEKKLKAKWVKALRSGKYVQAQQALYVEGCGYCCIGVLASVKKGGRRGFSGVRGGYDLATKEFGDSLSTRLQHMNDGGKSFAEIADYIEEKL